MSEVSNRDRLIKNQNGIFVDACVTQSVLIGFYLATILRIRYKGAHLMFVNWLIVLFVVSCATWVCVSWLALQIATDAEDLTSPCS